jgi:polyisoprenoid-binding protein YceI
MLLASGLWLSLWLAPHAAGATPDAKWLSDPAISQLTYTAFYEGAPIAGRFSDFRVAVGTDHDAVPVTVDVAVNIDSVAMGGRDIGEAIREPAWFDVERFPTANWQCEQIERAGDPGGTAPVDSRLRGGDATAGILYRGYGELRLKGVALPVSVPFSWQMLDAGTAQMQGQLELKRLDFGIGGGEWASGDEIGLAVRVEFSLTLQRQQ